MKRVHLTLAAALSAAVLVIAPALGQEEKPENLDATRTGVEKVDENRVPDSLSQSLEEFRQQTAEHRDAAIEAAEDLIAQLQAAADQAGASLADMSEEAKREWNEISAAVKKNLEEARINLEELQTAAAEKWDATRAAVADALERAANALQEKDKG